MFYKIFIWKCKNWNRNRIYLYKIKKQNCKPGYVVDDHLSMTPVTKCLKRLTRNWRVTSSFLSNLASNGVYTAFNVTIETVVSYTAFSPLHKKLSLLYAVIFCCTFLGVTSTGRYPASCPMKPGLSSP